MLHSKFTVRNCHDKIDERYRSITGKKRKEEKLDTAT